MLMRLIDEQFLDTPFYGVRQMTWHLRAEGDPVNEKRIRRLMRVMSLMPIYQSPKTSTKAKGHKIWPYLLRGLRIDRPNQVWCADVTYVPMRRGFLYLVVIMDWATRKVLAWRLSNTLEADFCVETLNEALIRFGPPDIMSTDQGSQFTSWAWTDRLRKAGVKISMDGKGRFLDNIFVERLWHWRDNRRGLVLTLIEHFPDGTRPRSKLPIRFNLYFDLDWRQGGSPRKVGGLR